MQKLDRVLYDIINIVKNDYAGFQEKKVLHKPRPFVTTCGTAFMNQKLDEKLFFQIVCQYLATLRDRNLHFYLNGIPDYQNAVSGFRTRRFGDNLYVTEVTEETRLSVGDVITALNHDSPGRHRATIMRNIFYSDTPERELWNGLIKMGNNITVTHKDGSSETLDLIHYPVSEPHYELSFELLDKSTAYLKLQHFLDTERIEKLINENAESLAKCPKLIIDVRKNVGGYDEAFYPLLPYIVDQDIMLSGLIEDEGIYTNYTEANCRRRASMLKAYKETADEESSEVLQKMIDELKEKSGSGLILEMDEELIGSDYKIEAVRGPEKVVIITDTYCENAGETFVELCRMNQRVTVIGRPTMGNIDYGNPVSVKLGNNFILTYPMSKRKSAQEGRGISDKGLPVDLYIPWSPEECGRDILLEKAMKL